MHTDFRDRTLGAIEKGILEHLLAARTRAALASGALRPIETETHFVEDGGVRFLVRVASSLLRKEEDREARARWAEASGERANPFLPYEEEMFVADVSDTHVALLNKFNVIERHLLVVTRDFVRQEELLDLADFRALDACMAECPGLGFYNGGFEGGASQPHKHLQLVPLPISPEVPVLPVESVLDLAGPRETVTTLPDLPFPHAFVRLDPDRDPRREETAARELELYRASLDRLGIGAVAVEGGARQSAPYNLLITRDWMLLVPRTREKWREISINALGFAGSLFVRSSGELRFVREVGPMAVLRAVTGPLPVP